MFDHVRQVPDRRAPHRPAALALAAGLTLGVIGLVVWGSLTLLARLGLDIRPPTVEVTYDPMGDGRTLEDLQAEERARRAASGGEEPAQDR